MAKSDIVIIRHNRCHIANHAIQMAVEQRGLVEGYKHCQQLAQENIFHACTEGTDIGLCLVARARLVDTLLQTLFSRCLSETITVFAVGGYGRGELHPFSDIDLLFLHDSAIDNKTQQGIEKFIQYAWDIGLKLGHSVVTVEECLKQASVDCCYFNNLLERRLLFGKPKTAKSLSALLDNLWPKTDFFLAKLTEQQERHEKYSDAGYSLEPNVKSSPGSLRDYQTIKWVMDYCTQAQSHVDLENYLNIDEQGLLTELRDFFWRVRFFLHHFAMRAEDRLRFDHQILLAKAFDYDETDHNRGVELFMKRYYRSVKILRRLNETILQGIEENLFDLKDSDDDLMIDENFCIRRQRISLIRENYFDQNPGAIMLLFYHIASQTIELSISTKTLKAMQAYLHQHTEVFRNHATNQELFIQILSSRQRLVYTLELMNKYGVLGRYLPEFGQVEGLMQFDLFHLYTVDSHILKVIDNLNLFLLNSTKAHCKLCIQLIRQCPNPEILIIAALYHDMAKGRQGDHSIIGAADAYRFCQKHGLTQEATRLICWLVQNHLLLSLTAQQKDISDPNVLHQFATQVKNSVYLNHLYILTVADIIATNPTLWNDWRHTLLKNLYKRTIRIFEQQLQHPASKLSIIHDRKKDAITSDIRQKFEMKSIMALWESIGDDYFIRYDYQEIIRHIPWLIKRQSEFFIEIYQHISESATDIFIHIPHSDALFVIITQVLDRMQLSVVAARIVTARNGFHIDTYTVLQKDNKPITNPHLLDRIKNRLKRSLIDQHTISIRPKVSAQHQNFRRKTSIEIQDDEHYVRSVIHISTIDRSGLLATIAYVLSCCDIVLLEAKIVTMGESVDDTFFVCDRNNQYLSHQAKCEFQELLMDKLS